MTTQLRSGEGPQRTQSGQAPMPRMETRHLLERRIPAKQFVAAKAREHHLHAVRAREFRNREGIEAIDARLITGDQEILEQLAAGRAGDRPLMVRGSEVERGLARGRALVVRMIGK